MTSNGAPPGSAEKRLGDIVSEVSQKATLLVKEEIELAKAEVTVKAKRLGRSAAYFAVALVTLIYFSIFFFVFLALGLNDWLSLKTWVGFAIVALLFLVITGVGAALGIRSFKRGSPPVPELAIAEARKTVATIEEARR